MKNALLLVDLQYDFMPGGALGVAGGDQIVPLANRLISAFGLVVATQDWHPPGHKSFASSHPGKKPGDVIDLNGIPQILWPDHCIQNTRGAELHEQLDLSRIHKVFRKGTDPNIDSYSALFDNAHLKSTGLGEYLKQEGVSDVYISGLATDYCVKYSSLDALALGLRVRVIADACRAVNLEARDEQRALDEMRAAGAEVVSSETQP